MTAHHVPVMVTRVVDLLLPALARDTGVPVVVDGTLGLGGHAAALLAACPRARLVGIDRDEAALEIAGRRLARFGGRTDLVRSTYDEIPRVLADLGLDRAHAVLLDVGLSSLQIDDAARGFSYTQDAPLDMRMDQVDGPTAADVLASASEEELTRILRQYGDEPHARRIAQGVLQARGTTPVQTTSQLVAIVDAAVPAAAHRGRGHVAKRVFQALRIHVNDELRLLAAALPAAISALRPGGRIAVLAYHSGEDRLVKRAFADGATDRTPVDLPVSLPSAAPWLRLVTHGAERPDQAEVEVNPRAASARLRVAEKLRDEPGSSGARERAA